MTREWNPSFYGHQQDGPLRIASTLTSFYESSPRFFSSTASGEGDHETIRLLIEEHLGVIQLEDASGKAPLSAGFEGMETAKRTADMLGGSAKRFYGNVEFTRAGDKLHVVGIGRGRRVLPYGSFEIDVLHYGGELKEGMELDAKLVKGVWGTDFGTKFPAGVPTPDTLLHPSEIEFNQWLERMGSPVRVWKGGTRYRLGKGRSLFQKMYSSFKKQLPPDKAFKALIAIGTAMVAWKAQGAFVDGIRRLMDMNWVGGPQAAKLTQASAFELSTKVGEFFDASFLASTAGVNWGFSFLEIAQTVGGLRSAGLKALQTRYLEFISEVEGQFPDPRPDDSRYQDYLDQAKRLLDDIRDFGGKPENLPRIHQGYRQVQPPAVAQVSPPSVPSVQLSPPIPSGFVSDPDRIGRRRVLRGPAYNRYVEVQKGIEGDQNLISALRYNLTETIGQIRKVMGAEYAESRRTQDTQSLIEAEQRLNRSVEYRDSLARQGEPLP